MRHLHMRRALVVAGWLFWSVLALAQGCSLANKTEELGGSVPALPQGWDERRFYEEYEDALVFILVETVDHSGTAAGKKEHTGTGFILTLDGYVLTNNHIVPTIGPDEYKSVLVKGKTRSRKSTLDWQELEVIQRFPEQDLVLLKFPETGQVFKTVRIWQ